MIKDLVTIVMNTYGGYDAFTEASVQSIRTFYPDIRIIFTEGNRSDLGLAFPADFVKGGDLVMLPYGTF